VTNLLVNEIYPAISGESRFSGWPCTLVRLTGCHLRCCWCDSEHSFQGGNILEIEDIVSRIDASGHRTVLITGGEPLLQYDVGLLLANLQESGYRVLLETSGSLMPDSALSLTAVPAGVHRIVDIKAPGSGIAAEVVDWDGIASLNGNDEIKLVLSGLDDYNWAKKMIAGGGLWAPEVTVSMSAVQPQLDPRDLAAWILADALEVRFQIQLHKAVWPDVDRGV